METALSCLVNGLVLSSMYILVASGFVLLVSILGIFNFAHGVIYMLGGYVTWAFCQVLGLNQWLALVLSVVIIGILGLFLERVCFRPFRANSNLFLVIAIIIILFLQTTVTILVGSRARGLPAYIPGTVDLGFVTTSPDRLITILIGGIVLALLTAFINRTKTGQQMLAVSQDEEGALLQGININRISALATMIACSLAALSGSLMSSILSMGESMGDTILVKIIQVMILSGIGSMGGIMLGGMIIGFLDAVLPVFLGGALAQTISLGVVICILVFRPKGLFGRELMF